MQHMTNIYLESPFCKENRTARNPMIVYALVYPLRVSHSKTDYIIMDFVFLVYLYAQRGLKSMKMRKKKVCKFKEHDEALAS